jgi:predicted ArsR family transcriptional regulator
VTPPEPARTIELTDATALRALAHPVRLRLVGLLRREGPLTATEAGALLGETPTTCSFHLRQLARYGLVEEAGGGRGRRRPWRATARSTSWRPDPDDPEQAAAAELLSSVIAERYLEEMRSWIARSAGEPADWRDAGGLGDALVHLTADELAGVRRGIEALLEPFTPRTADPGLRPEGSRLVEVLQVAFPVERRP